MSGTVCHMLQFCHSQQPLREIALLSDIWRSIAKMLAKAKSQRLKLQQGFCLGLMCLALAGCSVHPLVDDIAPLDTVAVVNKLRCEIRTAIKREFSNLIKSDPLYKERPDVANRMIEAVEEQELGWRKQIDRKLLSENSNRLIDRYDGTLIFMDFTFMNTEDNNNETNINLLSTLTAGTDALNIKASNNRRRSSTRNFRTQDSFEGIISAPLTCKGRSRNPDYLYPVTGEIGLYEIIDTFIRLNEGRSLIEGVPKERLFADTLAFTTVISGTLAPKIALSPVGKAVSLADAGFTSTNSRTDMHTVIVGLSLPIEVLPVPVPNQQAGQKQTLVSQINNLNFYLDGQVQRNLIMQLPAQVRPLTITLF